MTARIDGEAGRLLREAAEWRLIGLLFERPRGDWHGEVARLAPEIQDESLAQAAGAARETGEGDFLAALGPGGLVSDREVGHDLLAQPGALLADLAAFYRVFAYEPRTEEPLDHVSVEAGFVGYLRLKEAYAVSVGDAEAAEVTRAAAADFVRRHVSTLGEPLAQALADGPPYLALAARVLARRTGPSNVPKIRPPVADDGCGWECGTAAN